MEKKEGESSGGKGRTAEEPEEIFQLADKKNRKNEKAQPVVVVEKEEDDLEDLLDPELLRGAVPINGPEPAPSYTVDEFGVVQRIIPKTKMEKVGKNMGTEEEEEKEQQEVKEEVLEPMWNGIERLSIPSPQSVTKMEEFLAKFVECSEKFVCLEKKQDDGHCICNDDFTSMTDEVRTLKKQLDELRKNTTYSQTLRSCMARASELLDDVLLAMREAPGRTPGVKDPTKDPSKDPSSLRAPKARTTWVAREVLDSIVSKKLPVFDACWCQSERPYNAIRASASINFACLSMRVAFVLSVLSYARSKQPGFGVLEQYELKGRTRPVYKCSVMHVAVYLDKGYDSARASTLPPSNTDNLGLTALHVAVLLGRVEAVKALLERWSPNDQDPMGNTPLHFALVLGNVEIIRLLQAKGADPDINNRNQCPPIHLAMCLEVDLKTFCLDYLRALL